MDARQRAAIERCLDVLERSDALTSPLGLGKIAVGRALGYLDPRFAGEPCRSRRSRLARHP
jgi:glutathione S-transferase